MHDAVLTIDENGVVKTCNTAGLRILKIPIVSEILEHPIKDILSDKNDWLLNKLENVEEDEDFLDHEIILDGEKLSVNVSLLPLLGQKKENLGTMLMIEDISSEKRMKSTMSRYMDPELADQLMNAGDSDDIMGGKQSVGTVLFSDVRSFTTITEELGLKEQLNYSMNTSPSWLIALQMKAACWINSLEML